MRVPRENCAPETRKEKKRKGDASPLRYLRGPQKFLESGGQGQEINAHLANQVVKPTPAPSKRLARAQTIELPVRNLSKIPMHPEDR